MTTSAQRSLMTILGKCMKEGKFLYSCSIHVVFIILFLDGLLVFVMVMVFVYIMMGRCMKGIGCTGSNLGKDSL